MRNRLILGLGVAVLLSGCGGSGGGGNPGGGGGNGTTATPRVTIAWPARSRDFEAPASALSASIVLDDAAADGSDFSFQVNRPAGAAASIQTHPAPASIRTGTYLATLRFHAGETATGDVVGMTSATVKIAADGTFRRPDGAALGSIGFTGTVDRITVPYNQAVAEDETVDLAVSAFSREGNLLVISPGSAKIEVTGGGNFLRANADGTVTGLAAGTATVLARMDGMASQHTEVQVLLAKITPRSVDVPSKAMHYDSVRNRLWLAVPPSSSSGNSIVDVNPSTGAVGNPIFVGSDPDLLDMSDDASTMYVGLRGAQAVRRVNLETRTAGLTFSLSNQYNDRLFATDIKVQPGSNDTVGITTANISSSGTYGPAIYDNGVRRPNMLSTYQGTDLVWTAPDRIVTFNASHTGAELIDVRVDATGTSITREVRDGLGAFSSDLYRFGGRLYGANGEVVNETTLDRIGTFSRQGTVYADGWVGPAVDVVAHRAYFVEVHPNFAMLHIYSTDTFLRIGTARLEGVTLATSPYDFSLSSISTWGANGLAIRTTDRLYLVDDLPRP
ncbi:MAG: hypothetical protein ACO1SV_06540 [Fimbriimonas sp.]